MQHPGAGRRHLVLFTPDISDSSTVKRAQEFIDQGYALTVLGFRRDRYNRAYDPPWPYLLLGHTEDRKYLRRARALAAGFLIILGQRRRLRLASVFYARNIDQFVLAVLARALSCPGAFLAYEMLDIPPAHVGRGLASRLLRAVERFCLRRAGVLVVSSPGFVEHYFAPVQHYRGPWFLLENKVHPEAPPARHDATLPARRRRLRAPYRWVVGYHGLIRGADTFALMMRLAARLEGLVLFKFRGVLTTVDRDVFAAGLARHPNLVYEGDYLNPDDLASIYADVDFAWAIDLEHVAHNSRWLLPCRFYEAGLYGVPCLAVRDFEVGKLVDRLAVGWTFAGALEDELARFFSTLREADYWETRSRLQGLSRRAFVAGDDIKALCRILEGAAAGGSGEARHDGAEETVAVGAEAAHVIKEKSEFIGRDERHAVKGPRVSLLPP